MLAKEFEQNSKNLLIVRYILLGDKWKFIIAWDARPKVQDSLRHLGVRCIRRRVKDTFEFRQDQANTLIPIQGITTISFWELLCPSKVDAHSKFSQEAVRGVMVVVGQELFKDCCLHISHLGGQMV